MNNVHLIAVAMLFAAGATPVAAAEPDAAATVITGDLGGIGERADYVLNSAVVAGETLYLVLEDAADAGELVLRVPRENISRSVLALGQRVTLVAGEIGWLIEAAGKAIAQVPFEAVDALR